MDADPVGWAGSVVARLFLPLASEPELPQRAQEDRRGFRVDILVEDTVVVELKSVKEVLPVHEAQLISYLKLSKKPVGLLMNFNVASLRDGIMRRANTRQKT